MAVLTRQNSTTVKRTASAMMGYFGSLPALAGVEIRRADDPRQLPVPVLVVDCYNFDQRWPGSDEFVGELHVTYISHRDADADSDGVSSTDADLVANQEAHDAVAAAISNALEDQDGARHFLNAGAASRPVGDFHFYATKEHRESGEFSDETGGRKWQTDFLRMITVARKDYGPG